MRTHLVIVNGDEDENANVSQKSGKRGTGRKPSKLQSFREAELQSLVEKATSVNS